MKHLYSLLAVLALLHTGPVATATGTSNILGENWKVHSPSPSGTSADLSAIAVNGTTSMVAVGAGGALIGSTDGKVWTAGTFATTTPATNPPTTDLSGVTWSDVQSQYIAVGAGGTLLTSPDGLTWTLRTPPAPAATYQLNAVVATSATTLIAVGSSSTGAGVVLKSTNKGVDSWTSSTVPGALAFKDVIFAGGKLTAVCANKVFTSSNEGTTWTATTLAATTPTSIAYLPTTSTLVIIGSKSWSSTGSGPWTAITSPSADLVVQASGDELVGANGAGEVWSSMDAGQTWQARLAAQHIQLNAAAKFGDSYIVIGDSGVIEYSSGVPSDFLQRQTVPTPVQDLTSIATNGTSSAVAVGAGGKIISASVFSTWTNCTSNTSAALSKVIWAGQRYVAVGAGDAIVTSTDTVTWSAASVGSALEQLKGVASNGTLVVAVGENLNHAGIAMVSADGGQTWGSSSLVKFASGTKTVTAPSLVDVTWSGTEFVAVANGYALTSTNGVSWTAHPITGLIPTRITATASSVLVISGNKSWSSTDGSNWGPFTVPAPLLIDGAGDRLIGVTSTGQIWTYSYDPSYPGWQLRSGTQNIALTASTRFDSHFIVVGKGGKLETFAEETFTAPPQTNATGVYWTPVAAEANSVAWNGKSRADAIYVAVGYNISWQGTSSDPSNDSGQGNITWVPYKQGNNTNPYSMVSVIWTGTQFVAVGTNIWTSADGIAWALKQPGPSTNPSVYTVSQMTDGRILAFAYDSPRYQLMLSTSDDKGSTFTAFADMPYHRWAVLSATTFITTDGKYRLYLAVGWKGRFLVSGTGNPGDWSEAVVPGAEGDDFTAVTNFSFNDANQFVSRTAAVTIDGAIWNFAMDNTGHTTWTKSTIWKRNAAQVWVKSPDGLASHSIWCVQRSTNEFIAAGNYGYTLKSFNGTDWREYPPDAAEGSHTTQYINSLIYATDNRGPTLVAAGGLGTFLTSDGGVDPSQPTITITPTPSIIRELPDPTSTPPILAKTTVTVSLAAKIFNVPITLPLRFSGPKIARYTTDLPGLPVKLNDSTQIINVTFAPDQSSMQFTLQAVDDQIAQVNDEILSISSSLSAWDFATATTTSSITIKDNESPNPVTIKVDTPTLTENSQPSSATVTVTVDTVDIAHDIVVPLSFAGSAASSSYSTTLGAGVNSIIIQHGHASNSFQITPLNDNVANGDHTVTVSVGQPPLYASIGSPGAVTVTIVNDDTAPTFSTPANQLVPVGSPVSIPLTITNGKLNGAAAAFTAQWQKNGVGLTNSAAKLASTSTVVSFPYQLITSAALSDAGSYNAVASSPSVSAKSASAAALLGVVNTAPQTITVKANGSASLVVPAAGTGLTYQWKRNGTPITGATRSLYTTTSLPTGTNTDVYVCTVGLDNGTSALSLDSGNFNVNVVSSVPVITPPVFSVAAVAASFSFTPAASPTASRWTITGLPAGLSYNSNFGTISGAPTKAGSFAITFVASNAMGNSVAVKATLVVSALPANGVGTFVCTVNGDGVVSTYLGGRIDLTTTGTGSFSGKFTDSVTGSAKGDAFTGTFAGTVGNSRSATVSLRSQTVTLHLVLDTVQGIVTGTVSTGADTPAVKGWRQTAVTSALSGSYTCALSGTDATAGFGYGQLTVNATGAVTVTGTLADSSAPTYSLSTVIGPGGQIGLYSPLSTNVGYLAGELDIAKGTAPAYANNSVAGSLYWLTTVGSNATKLTADGGRYIAPASGQYVMNLSASKHTVTLAFTGADLTADDAKTPTRIFSVNHVPTNVATPPAINPAATSLSFVPATGVFSGRFLDLFATGTPARDYSGVLIRPGGALPVIGKGFFGAAAATGSVNLTPVP